MERSGNFYKAIRLGYILISILIGCMVKGCSSLASVTIPNSVTSIQSYAFMETGLVSVTIPSSVTKIEAFAFYKSNISEVISKITKPFKIDPTVFSSYTFKNATLYVPSGTVNIYKNIEFWNQFSSVPKIRNYHPIHD